ncbi:MAG: response regulator [Calditrichaceae bacterium]|nr:response regulator [Calditrichia bacterium]NUQ41450.1 response regulator [Calditrichaceae bacterium]
MAFLLLVVAVILFVLADLAIRKIGRAVAEKRARREREEALAVNLKLDFSHEAKTLKRVEVENPKARILAVDDEEVILDSFRKILVLDGYCVDTVQRGQEALGLIQKHHYDFVFVDLKMPEMDGVEVCKSVKHLRPDIDVIIITGYASVETAVETMKFGAMDYVQKPFTEDELLEMVKKFAIRRQDRIHKQLKPQVRITHFTEAKIPSSVEFYIPGGVFISEGHCWASLDPDGNVFVGIDDFAKKIIGKVDGVEMPNLGMEVQRGQHLFSVKQGAHSIPFKSPVSGKVKSFNKALLEDLERLDVTAYDDNWFCRIDASRIDWEIKELKIGQSAVSFYNDEIERLQNYIQKSVKSTEDETKVPADGKLYLGELAALKEKDLAAIIQDFFER